MKSETYFCLACKTGPFPKEEIGQHGCQPPYNVIQSIVTVTKTKRRSFIDWLLSFDIGYGLAFFGAVMINALLLPHFGLSFGAEILESFCLGLFLIRLLKD